MTLKVAASYLAISIALLAFSQGNALAETETDPQKMTRAEAAKKFPLLKSDFERKEGTGTKPKKSSAKKSAKFPGALELLKNASATKAQPLTSEQSPTTEQPSDAQSEDEKLVQSEQEKLLQKKAAADAATAPAEQDKPHYRKKIRNKRTIEKSGADLRSAFAQSSTEASGATSGSSDSSQNSSSLESFRIPR